MSINDTPVFPRPATPIKPAEDGVTLRDYFAARILAAMVGHIDAELTPPEPVAALAYRYADAMLAHRTQETK